MRTTTAKKTAKSLAILAAATTAVGLGTAAPALAEGHDGAHSFQAELAELNDSGASGTAWFTLEGDQLTVEMETAGLLDGAPHAQHIHIGGAGQCPDPDMEGTGVDGAIRTTDAIDDYGMIGASLTLEGDTSPDSGLAVDRYPATGSATYERTFTVSQDVADSLEEGTGVVVLHGVDHNGSGEYDGEQMSDLDDSLPSEATDPAACGAITASQMDDMPEGGVETGQGTTAGLEHGGMLAAGGALTATGVVGLGVARRRAARVEK